MSPSRDSRGMHQLCHRISHLTLFSLLMLFCAKKTSSTVNVITKCSHSSCLQTGLIAKFTCNTLTTKQSYIIYHETCQIIFSKNCICRRAILRYSFCRGRDILDIHPSITLSILLVEHSCCTYMEAVTYVFQCVINIFL